MKVFVTGASGFVGQATLAELISHGHEVTGLVRSDASAEIVTKLGGSAVRGGLPDHDILKQNAQASDAVLHLAFIHEFKTIEDMAKSNQVDRDAIQAIGEALSGSNKPFLVASGTLGYPWGELATEDSVPMRQSPMAERQKAADLLHSFSKDKGVKGMLIRFPPTVHGKGDKGFITMLGGMAKQNGFVTYVNEGSTRWPATHRADVASCLRLALEKGKAGATYNAIAEQGISMKETMTAIGKKLKLPVESKTPEEGQTLLGFFGHIVVADNPTSSEKTKAELGWQPKEIGLLEDIEKDYF